MKLKTIHSLMFAAGMTVATLASAQAPAPAPASGIPPTWAQGRTPDGMNPSLAPNPPGISAMPADEIPVSKLKVPAGFKIELWASGMPNGRSMTESPSGTVYVGTRFTGNVYAVVTKNGKREVKTIAKGLRSKRLERDRYVNWIVEQLQLQINNAKKWCEKYKIPYNDYPQGN